MAFCNYEYQWKLWDKLFPFCKGWTLQFSEKMWGCLVQVTESVQRPLRLSWMWKPAFKWMEPRMPQWKYSQFYLTSQISRQVVQCYVIFEEMCEGVISQKWFQWASDKYVMLLLVLLKISFWSYIHYGILQEEYLSPCMQKMCNKVLVSHSRTKYWKCTLPITSSKNGILGTSFLVITICCLW